MDEYEPEPEDWRITLKAFGDHKERKVFAFVGRSQMSPEEDRDLTAEELKEDMGKDVTSCVDFKGDFPKLLQLPYHPVNRVFISELKIYLGTHPDGLTTKTGKKSRRSGSKQALALRIATPLQGKNKPLYGQIITSRMKSMNIDNSSQVNQCIPPQERQVILILLDRLWKPGRGSSETIWHFTWPSSR